MRNLLLGCPRFYVANINFDEYNTMNIRHIDAINEKKNDKGNPEEGSLYEINSCTREERGGCETVCLEYLSLV